MTGPSQTLPDGLLYYTRCPAPTATGLAVGLDLLAPELRDQHQVRLQALQDVTDTELRRRHFDHGITNLIREGGNIPALWAYSSGVPTRLIGVTWLDEYQAIVTRPGSPIHSPDDLAGRRVPVPVSPGSVIDVGRASTLRGFERALSTVGLGLNDLRIVDTPPEPALTGPSSRGRGESFDTELDLLDRGEADAVWLKGAAGVAAVRERGLAEVFRIDLDADPLVRVNNGTPRTITARQELIDEHPDLVRTYLTTLLTAPSEVADDRTRLWGVLSAETHQSVEAAETAYVNVAEDSLAPALTSDRLRALQHQADFLAAQGFIPHRIDVTAWSADLLTAQAANV